MKYIVTVIVVVDLPHGGKGADEAAVNTVDELLSFDGSAYSSYDGRIVSTETRDATEGK